MKFVLSPSFYTLGFGPGGLKQLSLGDCGKDSTAEIVVFKILGLFLYWGMKLNFSL